MVPPGFRFRPTDQELISFFLLKKVRGEVLPWDGIREVDIYGEKDPWEIFGDFDGLEEKHYFFTKLKKVKSRAARSAGCGTWHLSSNRYVYEERGQQIIGLNRQFSFKAKQGSCVKKSNWVMHEFSLAGASLVGEQERSSDWVLCTVIEKGSERKRLMNQGQNMASGIQVLNTETSTNELLPEEGFRERKKMRYNIQSKELQAAEMPLSCSSELGSIASQVTPSASFANSEEDVEAEDITQTTELETYVGCVPSNGIESQLPLPGNFVENDSPPADSAGTESEHLPLDSWWTDLFEDDFFDTVFV